MKKVLSIILAAFCISLTYSYADNAKSTQEPKKPIMIFKGDYITLNVPPRAFSNVPLQIWSL